MFRYIIRRILSMIPSLLIVSVLVFLFIHFIPGDPAQIMLGDLASVEEVAQLRMEMGLDQPIAVQYGKWLKNLVSGDMGNSIFFHQSVSSVIKSRAETSILLSVMTLLIIIFIGIPIGYLSATRYGSRTDQIVSSLSMIFASIPTFWLGLTLMTLFSVKLQIFPSSGFPSIIDGGNLSNLIYLVLPSITLAAPNSALIIRLTRASMLDLMKEDYVRTARAKGMSTHLVNIKHVFRNSLNAVASAMGFTFAALVSGTVVTETVFSLPGIGSLVVDSILRRDYPVLQGIILTIALLYMLINLLVDISYVLLDPRIQHRTGNAR